MFASRWRVVSMFALMLMLLAVGTLGADFTWTQGVGPPFNMLPAKCEVATNNCATSGCTNVNPAVKLKGQNGATYTVKSYNPNRFYDYGLCQAVDETLDSTCKAYPYGHTQCALLIVFSNPNCDEASVLGNTIVYSGTCEP